MARPPYPRSPALAVAALALAAALALTGCGLGAGPAPKAVKLLVTRDFGATVLAPNGTPAVAGQETVMSLLLRNHRVGTRYGGGFVQSVDGLAGGQEGGAPVDWFYYVNGVEASKGAAATNVAPGDHIWWDRHDWSQTDDVPAVVGSFPEPFLNGLAGKRLPVRIECASVEGGACRTVTDRLRALGVPAAISALGSGGGSASLRVLVGPWSALASDLTVATLARGPRASGVYATITGSAPTLALLDEDGRTVARSARAGLIAATRQGEDAPVWVVTGTDDAAAQQAAANFDAQTLEHRFAVAVLAGQPVPLPERARR